MRLVDAEFEEKHYLSMADNPTPDVTENDKRTALAIARAFQMARTVAPERKTGKWIDTGEMDEWWAEVFTCSECGWLMLGTANYCPNCGADMRGEDNETN